MMTTETNQRRDARAVAKLLISHYGVQAGTYASHQALKARERGDERLMQAWGWIAGAVGEVVRADPEEDGGRQEEEPGRSPARGLPAYRGPRWRGWLARG